MSSTSVVPFLPTSLPPVVLTFLKWLEQTSGRDKVYRFVAYFSKWVVQTMKQNNISPDWAERLNKGGSAIGQTRKLMRFFRSLEYVNEFLKSFTIKDEVERYLSLFKAFSLGVWMVADHIQWMQKAGYLKLADLKKIDELHSKGWFYGLLTGIIICLYKLKQVVDDMKNLRSALREASSQGDSSKVAELNKKLKEGDDKRNKQIMGVVKNSFDIVIPSARLKWLDVSDGTVGLAGTVTSVIGMYDTWPKAK